MIIKSISLTNFRNHHNYKLDCDEKTSLILGSNGWGKTSILEAIYILTRGKSFRATDPEIINHNSDYYRIELEYQNGEKIIATYDGKSKTFIVSDKKQKRLPKKHKYPVILFLPSDLNLISHSPSRRRDYFDRIFSELDEKYATNLSKYNKALKQRNELLKKEFLNSDSLFSWNVMLAKYGTEIKKKRQENINKINQTLTDTYRSIAENQDEVNIIYKTETQDISEQNYLNNLEKNYERDHYLGHTTFGIHRDDYLFEFNHKVADTTASRGETRSIILALKFIEANLLNQAHNQNPIILLDDVFSELDDTRRHCLIKNFKNNQVIITSVELID